MTAVVWGREGGGRIRTTVTVIVGFSEVGLLACPDKSRLGCTRNEAPVLGVQDNKRTSCFSMGEIRPTCLS